MTKSLTCVVKSKAPPARMKQTKIVFAMERPDDNLDDALIS